MEWGQGDTIVVSPTRFRSTEAERLSATSISSNNKIVTLGSALLYPHSGRSRNYTRSAPQRTWTLDTSAAVASLSRNIRIVAPTHGHRGAHIKIKRGGIGRVDGVLLKRLGIAGQMGQYPMHWYGRRKKAPQPLLTPH